MESDIHSAIPSHDGLIPELDDGIYSFSGTSNENAMTSAFAGNSFDESLGFSLSLYPDFANNDPTQLLGNDFFFLDLPNSPATFNESVENQPV
ncbi:hypothetical protein UA08_02342 [Talaromyces atroroseus]|uniref:Uncharacterized protein n=1 Tax=Talaromyces atroroseus TaxID=1441469 RepID=A0A225ARV5_TALAT|nr:hypothetical protein UA08_02342 [Talaromyces atroroseus]OKL62233.1 hypothetical protein UA08_02342 [Talaromyces atroroseus]